jgi:hypothetical protein
MVLLFRVIDRLKYFLPSFRELFEEVTAIALDTTKQLSDFLNFQIHSLVHHLPNLVVAAIFAYLLDDSSYF